MIQNIAGTSSYKANFCKEWRSTCASVKKGLRLEDEPVKPIKCKEATGDMRGYEELGNAVVMCAVGDWRSAYRALLRNPHDKKMQAQKDECEAFFLSEYFNTFTNLDGAGLLSLLIRQEEEPLRNFLKNRGL